MWRLGNSWPGTSQSSVTFTDFMKKPLNNSATGNEPAQNSPTGKDDGRFWRALQKENTSQASIIAPDVAIGPSGNAAIKTDTTQPVTEPNPVSESATDNKATQNDSNTRSTNLFADPPGPDPEQSDRRRRALRSMLAASEARQKQILRSRLPPLSPGLRVFIKSGLHRHLHGVIVDADFIHSRVLLDLEDGQEAQWVEFARVAPINLDDEPENKASS